MRQQTHSRSLGWFICGIAALFYSYEYFLRIAPSTMSWELMKAYSIDAASLGNLAAFYYYAYTPMQLPVGILLDRYGPRRILTVACACCVVGTCFFAVAHSLVIAQLGRLLMGFGSAFAFIGVLKLATIWLPPERFGFVAGMTAMLGTAGAMIGDTALSYAVQTIGWRETLYGAIAVGALIIILISVFVRDHVHHTIHDRRKAKATAGVNWLGIIAILKNRQMWIIGGMGCLIYLPTTVFGEMWGIPYLRDARHFSHMHAALAVSMLFLGFTCGSPTWGYLSDKFHTRRKPFIIGTLLALATTAVLIYIPHLSFALACGLLFILGLSYSVQALVFALAHEHSPPRLAATGMAITNMFVMLGGLLLQPMVGVLLDLYEVDKPVGNTIHHIYSNVAYSHALMIMPLGLIGCALLSLILKETGCKPQFPANYRLPHHTVHHHDHSHR